MARKPTKPLVAIVGATGTGKSDLAVDLALRFNGEIINGDAMQLYRGLPIITNKITPQEQKGIPHHLLGCIGLEEETWTVGKFVTEALGVINEIRSRGKLPILVGGTHYYTQALLLQDGLPEEPGLDLNGDSRTFPILEGPTEAILQKLQEVDPIMADRWHPNDRRKIQRSLEIYLRTGKPASRVYEEQRFKQYINSTASHTGLASGTGSVHGLRFPTLVLWVHASKETLNPRLDARIIKMLNRGLLSEVSTLSTFRAAYESRTATKIDQSRGIWVSIGYKEFLNYHASLLHASSTDVDVVLNIKAASIEKTQAATRQYAKRQVRWIRIKLLNSLPTNQPPTIFLLDASDLSQWGTSVVQPAQEITEKFLSGDALPNPLALSDAAVEMLTPKRDYDLSQRPDLWQKRACETCGIIATTENDWKLHGASRAHRRAVGVKKKAENKREGKDLTVVQKVLVENLETLVVSTTSEQLR